MALKFQTPPEKAVRSITAALQALQAAPVPGFRIGGEPGIAALRNPHVIYHLGLDDLAAGRGVEASTPVGWGQIAGSPGGELLAETKFDTQELSQLNQGPYAAGIANSIARAEADPRVKARDYQVGVLRIPGIYVIALWLKDVKGNDDAIVPVPPVPQELEADRFYSLAEFTNVAIGMAKKRLEFDNSPRG
jgi:hypothetical protein